MVSGKRLLTGGVVIGRCAPVSGFRMAEAAADSLGCSALHSAAAAGGLFAPAAEREFQRIMEREFQCGGVFFVCVFPHPTGRGC